MARWLIPLKKQQKQYHGDDEDARVDDAVVSAHGQDQPLEALGLGHVRCHDLVDSLYHGDQGHVDKLARRSVGIALVVGDQDLLYVKDYLAHKATTRAKQQHKQTKEQAQQRRASPAEAPSDATTEAPEDLEDPEPK